MATTATSEAVIGKKRKFPLSAKSHGDELVTVVIGEGSSQRKFHIHKSLLAKASEYFDRALNGSFVESAGTLKLVSHCPVAFEVVYQWLYSGTKLTLAELKEFHDFEGGPYSDTSNGHARIWLRLYKLADETLIFEMKVHAYQMLTSVFARSTGIMYPAGEVLIRELFDTNAPQQLLQDYVARHNAWILYCRSISDAVSWEKTWQDNPEYAPVLLRHIVAISKNRNNLDAMHPSIDRKFAVENVFPSETEK